jgi:hypothetical protein
MSRSCVRQAMSMLPSRPRCQCRRPLWLRERACRTVAHLRAGSGREQSLNRDALRRHGAGSKRGSVPTSSNPAAASPVASPGDQFVQRLRRLCREAGSDSESSARFVPALSRCPKRRQEPQRADVVLLRGALGNCNLFDEGETHPDPSDSSAASRVSVRAAR